MRCSLTFLPPRTHKNASGDCSVALFERLPKRFLCLGFFVK